ncbi:MAG: CHAD domain-containing protein [Edaphobacter sp.]
MPQPVTVFLRQSLTLNAAIAACLKDPSIKSVHRLRSSTRRIEATLELLTISTSLRLRSKAKPLRKILRTLRRAAGAVRDLDVHRKLLKPYRKNHDTAKLEKDLAATREKSTRKLRTALHKSKKQLHRELTQLETLLQPAVDLSLNATTLLHLTTTWFAKAIANLDPLQDDQLHSIRKAGKTARYIAEPGVTESGAADSKSVAALATRFEDAQEILGAWHDCLLLLDEARSILPEQSPTIVQLQEKSVQLRCRANEAATDLLATFHLPATRNFVH